MTRITVQEISLAEILPSPTNPRKSFDAAQLDQLAESIKAIGITVPLLVRPVFDETEMNILHYELVSGARRLKAAAIAGRETVPAFVRELNDADALDIQMVENLQRADLHPMDEAAGYQALIEASHVRGVELTQQELAHKVGKPVSYVAQRVKLLDLAETPRKVFQDGHINIGHALLLARLTPDLQTLGLRTIFDPDGESKKVKDIEAVVEKAVARAANPNQYLGAHEPARPVSTLKRWVKSYVELDLGQAPWDLAATNLHPKAGSCNACPKRSGNNPALFSEMTTGDDKCTDPDCFDIKAKTFVHITSSTASPSGLPMLRLSFNWGYEPIVGNENKLKRGQWEPAEEGTCPDARQGVMVEGSDMGKVLFVCINQACKLHKHTVERPRANTPEPAKPSPKDEAEKERRSKQRAAERDGLFSAVRKAASLVPRDQALIYFVLDSIDRDNGMDVGEVLKLNEWTEAAGNGWKGQEKFIVDKVTTLTGEPFCALIFDIIHADLCDYAEWNYEESEQVLVDLAGRYSVDVDAVLKAVKDQNPTLYEVPKPEPVKTPKKAAKKAAKKSSAKKKAAATKPKLTDQQKKNIADATAKRFVDRKTASTGDDDDDQPAEAPAPGTQCSECRSMDGYHKLSCSKTPGLQDEEPCGVCGYESCLCDPTGDSPVATVDDVEPCDDCGYVDCVCEAIADGDAEIEEDE